MATIELTTENFDEVTSQDGIVLVDFWASWCQPCLRFSPIFERVAEKHPDIVFTTVDTEAQQAIAAQFDIRSLPTVMAIRDSVIVYAAPGLLPERALEELITNVRELDMDEVRETTAATQG